MKKEYKDPLKNKNEHWQINRDLTPKGSPTAKGAFLPMPGKDRPTTHVKTNECDY